MTTKPMTMKRAIWIIKYIYYVRKLMPYISGKSAWRMSRHTRFLFVMGYSPQAVAKYDRDVTENKIKPYVF